MDKKNKIAIVVYTLKAGGLERVVSNQTFMFHALGFEVELFVLKNEIEYPYKGKLHIYDLNENDSFLTKMKEYFKIKKDIQKGNFDFVIDHRYRLNAFMERFWLKFIYKKQRLIYFIHSANFTSYINKELALQPNIEFISVSKGIENLVKANYSSVKIKTIYNSVQVPKITKVFQEISDNYILGIGRMDESNVKQFDVLIDCFSKSILPKNNVKLLILGSGVRKEVFEQKVIDLNLKDKIIFKGFETELYSFYKNAKFLVLSSKYEGLPTVLIESLLCETPVISYNCDFGPNEIIQNEINGLLVENQNKEKLIEAMNLFFINSDLYLKCKENAKKSVSKFTEKSIAAQWKTFFNDKH